MKTRMSPVFWTTAVLLGCDVDLDGLAQHECDTNTTYSAGWPTSSLELDHTDPRICPHELDQVGQYMTAGGVLTDYSSSYQLSSLRVTNSDGATVGYYETFFQDGAGYRYSQMSVAYNAGTGVIWQYDTAVYSAYSSTGSDHAGVDITYTLKDCTDCI